MWEWIWASSIIPAAIAWLACKKSKAFNMKIFQALNVATGLIPVFLGKYTLNQYKIGPINEKILILWRGHGTKGLIANNS